MSTSSRRPRPQNTEKSLSSAPVEEHTLAHLGNATGDQDALQEAALKDESITITTDDKPAQGLTQDEVAAMADGNDGSIVVTKDNQVTETVEEADHRRYAALGSTTITGPNAPDQLINPDKSRKVAGRPACRVITGYATVERDVPDNDKTGESAHTETETEPIFCPRPEVVDNAGICGAHYSTRADLRRAARRD